MIACKGIRVTVSGAAQNVSSVQCYLWDITLLFAQRRDNIELAKQISHLQVGKHHFDNAHAHFALSCAPLTCANSPESGGCTSALHMAMTARPLCQAECSSISSRLSFSGARIDALRRQAGS